MGATKRLTAAVRRMATGMMVWVLSTSLALPVQAEVVITDVVHGGVDVRPPQVQLDGRIRTDIVQSTARAIVHASDFNIAPNHVVNVIQPNASAWMLARVFGPATQIDGALNATGSLILLNPNGVFIGPTGQVNVGGLFAASTLGMSNGNFLNGLYLFQDSGTNGVIRNAGTINAGVEGVYLFAPNVENSASGIITSANGHVSLGAGRTAFLSNRPDGRGFLSEVTAPAGEALNLGQLLADGGQVTMAGRVVNQGNLVQANSVVQRNGRIELVASEQVTMRTGSRTISMGSEAGAHGGTVIARAAGRDQSGTRIDGAVTVESGATVDVAPGSGGVAGEVWLGGTVTSNGLVHRLIPNQVTLGDSQLLALAPGVARGEINVLAMDDINVTVTEATPLDTLGLPFGQAATLHLNAGRSLRFTNSDFKAFSGLWHIVARAGSNLSVTASEISIGSGGSLHLHAGGTLSLVDGSLGPAKVNTGFGGGNISLNAGEDVVIPGPFGTTSDDGLTLPGVHVGIPGNLIVRAGRDIRGSGAARDTRGPGFTLQGGAADLSAGRDIGSEQTPLSIVVGGLANNPDGSTSVTRTEASIKAGGSLYFGLAEDYGLRELQTLTANSSLSLIARTGDILIKPGRLTGAYSQTRRILPASFSAQADEGSVIFETGTSSLSFWPSSSGSIRIFARQDIRGQGSLVESTAFESVLIFVGSPGDPTARYVRVNRPEALADPVLARWFGQYGDLSFVNGIPLNPLPGNILPPANLQNKPTVTVRNQSPALLTLNGGDVDELMGSTFNTESELTRALNPSTPLAASHAPASPVTLTAETGDISRFQLDFLSYRFLKEVAFSAGRDISGLSAKFLVPVLPTGNPAVRVHARGNIDMRTENGDAGLIFIGQGTGEIRAGGNIDLANSTGIQHKSRDGVRSDRFQGGLLDIGAGGGIDMTQSRITTLNGGSIFIHGADGVRIVDAAGRPIPGTVETRALLVNQGDTMVLALPNESGAAVPIEAYRTVLSVDQATTQNVFTTQDISNGRIELVWKPLFVEQTGQLLLVGGERVRQGDQIVFHEKVVPVDLSPARTSDGAPILVDGRPALVDGRIVLEVGGQSVALVSPVGGRVNIGGATTNSTEQTGITTFRGGNITIHSTDDVNVNRSRVGTFDTGNILIKSTAGTINAGSGSRNERTTFLIDNGDGTNTVANVPGSGIFTWERDDPDFATLPFPKFNTPRMDALLAQIAKRRFLGRDASDLAREFDRLAELRKIEYDQVFEDFIDAPFGPGSRSLQLGDISLIAARNIDVPSAGIRGRRINLEAGDALNLLGGSIIGKTTFSASSVSGSLGSFAGAAAGSVGGASVSAAGGAGGSSVGGLSGVTSTVSATSASTSTTSSTAAKAVEQVQQTAEESTGSAADARKQVASKDGEKEQKSQMASSVRMKRGVVIQVDVKPEAQPGP
jgi:filamentous hemagglutinin family protein